MSHVSEVALSRALLLLKSVKAQFKVIMPDGAEHGELVVVQPKSKTRQRGPYAYGAINAYFSPLIGNMKAGDMVEVPWSEFEAERLRGGISAYAVQRWGKQSAITVVNREKKVIEVLRVS